MKSELITQISKDGELDKDWVALILEALELGISTDEIRDFFSSNKLTK
ncbi:anti-repressor SinI family protein [Metabacillus malikii]|uniref:Sin domain-containing protein n=1 Tax=Metabacillus malikii TaxID=1504265 RepID=A0ABT9ZI46_9BACI|nr:anti-repressor SinI family protein [Metabacillus malikii]MDQ0231953.1 hypothetical protein [Metabacillus malikii]